MPTATFDNLPRVKKEGFLRHAFEEFSTNDYNSASISKMVRKFQMAKGSVYQYFEDKRDLYLYLVELAQDKRMDYLLEAITGDFYDFWELFEQMILAEVKFALENPKYHSFLNLVAQQWTHPELGNLKQQFFERNIRSMQQQLSKEADANRLRTDVELDSMAYIVSQLSDRMIDWIAYKLKIDLGKPVEDPEAMLEAHEEEIVAEVRMQLDALKTGFWK